MDAGGIYLKLGTGELVEMRQQPYKLEDVLQELLANHPALLAGEQMNTGAPRRWLLISRELGVPSTSDGGNIWEVDHLFLDQDAIPTIIEAKRSSNPDIRREVVGQMLEYAANAVANWSVDKMRDVFEANTLDPIQKLADFLEPDANPDEFWQRVGTNLLAGRVRLVFVADIIPERLRRVVEFLNIQMRPAEVLAVEVRQYVGGDLTALVPRLIGQTANSEQKKATPSSVGPRWDEKRFFQRMEERKISAEAIEIARKILKWSDDHGLIIKGGLNSSTDGCLTPILHYRGRDYRLFRLWPYGKVEISFEEMREPFAFIEARQEILKQLNAIPGITISEGDLTGRPNLELSTLQEPTRLDQFLQVFDWMIAEIKTH